MPIAGEAGTGRIGFDGDEIPGGEMPRRLIEKGLPLDGAALEPGGTSAILSLRPMLRVS